MIQWNYLYSMWTFTTSNRCLPIYYRERYIYLSNKYFSSSLYTIILVIIFVVVVFIIDLLTIYIPILKNYLARAVPVYYIHCSVLLDIN